MLTNLTNVRKQDFSTMARAFVKMILPPSVESDAAANGGPDEVATHAISLTWSFDVLS